MIFCRISQNSFKTHNSFSLIYGVGIFKKIITGFFSNTFEHENQMSYFQLCNWYIKAVKRLSVSSELIAVKYSGTWFRDVCYYVMEHDGYGCCIR